VGNLISSSIDLPRFLDWVCGGLLVTVLWTLWWHWLLWLLNIVESTRGIIVLTSTVGVVLEVFGSSQRGSSVLADSECSSSIRSASSPF
jgi:hypothetical protein